MKISTIFLFWTVFVLTGCSMRAASATILPEQTDTADTLNTSEIDTISTEAHIEIPNDSIIEVKIEMIVFSGRRNPVWLLTPEEQILFHDVLVQSLPAPPNHIMGQLGYTGFEIKITTSTRIISIQIYDELIIYHDAGQVFFYQDVDRVLEQLIFETSKAHIDPDLYRTIQNTLPDR